MEEFENKGVSKAYQRPFLYLILTNDFWSVIDDLIQSFKIQFVLFSNVNYKVWKGWFQNTFQ